LQKANSFPSGGSGASVQSVSKRFKAIQSHSKPFKASVKKNIFPGLDDLVVKKRRSGAP